MSKMSFWNINVDFCDVVSFWQKIKAHVDDTKEKYPYDEYVEVTTYLFPAKASSPLARKVSQPPFTPAYVTRTRTCPGGGSRTGTCDKCAYCYVHMWTRYARRANGE